MRLPQVTALLAALSWPGALHAQSMWHVDVNASPGGDGGPSSPYQTIGAALSSPQVQSGDVVRVRPGTYAERVDFQGKSLVLQSEGGPLLTVIDAQSMGPAVSAVSGEGAGAIIRGFTVRNGRTIGESVAGGGIKVADSRLRVVNCTIQSNVGDLGAGCAVEHGVLELARSRVLDNTRPDSVHAFTLGGGVYSYGSELHLDGCTVEGNGGSLQGGGAWIGGGSVASIGSSTFVMNRAHDRGAGIYITDSRVRLFDSKVSRCLGPPGTLFASGGLGIFADVPAGWVQLDRCWITTNQDEVADGAGVHGPIIARDCVFASNWAQHFGGGVWEGASLERCVFYRNTSSPFNEGGPGSFGGAKAEVAVSCLFLENAATVGAGAYQVDASYCRFVRNQALPAGASTPMGAGLLFGTGFHCRFEDNVGTAPSQPLSVFPVGIDAWGSNLTRCELVSATAVERGAAISMGLGSLDHCTVYGTTLVDGSGQPLPGGDVLISATVTNSIIWGYTTTNLVFPGTPGTTTIEWSDTGGGAYPGIGNISTDPKFVDAANGDLRLLDSSPCIDAGDPSFPGDRDGSVSDLGASVAGANQGYVMRGCPVPLNSLGWSPILEPCGWPSVAGPRDDFALFAAGLTYPSWAVLLFGYGSGSHPFAGSTTCIAQPSPWGRPIRVRAADESGTQYEGSVLARIHQGDMAGAGLLPGSGGVFQLAYRDPGILAGVGFTPSVCFTAGL